MTATSLPVLMATVSLASTTVTKRRIATMAQTKIATAPGYSTSFMDRSVIPRVLYGRWGSDFDIGHKVDEGLF